jgi:EAL domain-containing protein (putative c-di-GMP-specific phosphodiesterase class I)
VFLVRRRFASSSLHERVNHHSLFTRIASVDIGLLRCNLALLLAGCPGQGRVDRPCAGQIPLLSVTTHYHESPLAGEELTASDGADGGPELADILRHSLIHSVFQPIVELETRLIAGYEALIRGPEGSPLEQPDRLFAEGRRCGRLVELDLASQRTGLAAAADAGLTDPWSLFLNLEPEVAQDALKRGVDTQALQSGTSSRAPRLRVVAELTERALTADPAHLLGLVALLRSRGWGIALDDVGADRDSLALLPFIHPDVIKLDLRLIQQRPTADVAEIFSAVNAEAERSGATVLAEGIETHEHLNVARSLGATLGQGWLFGRPRPLPRPLGQLCANRIRIRVGGPNLSAASPFALAAAALPPRSARKALLIEISKHLEREAIRSGEAAVVLSCFQDVAFFTPATRRRYSRLAQGAAFVGVLGLQMPLIPMPGIRGRALSPSDPLVSEWHIAVIGPHFAACLVARDLGDDEPDMQRRFEFVLSHNRELAISVATALISRISDEKPEP